MGNSFELGNDKMNWVDIKSVEIISSNYLKPRFCNSAIYASVSYIWR